MSNCFQLRNKHTGNVETLVQVDENICTFLKREIDPVNWVDGWYDTIGLSIAYGKSWSEIRNFWVDRAPIVDYLQTNYTVDIWYEH